MNGRMAKRLRREATMICKAKQISPGDGYRTYRVHKKTGTIRTGWKWRACYRWLKQSFPNGYRVIERVAP